jgi:hypothetical protein
MTETPRPPRAGVAAAFRAELLPRWRALLAVGGFGAALLSAGGMIEYGSGSPAIQGTPAATYWGLFFALNTVAFGGAALLAGFPSLARLRLKLAWLVAMAALYFLAFTVWRGQQPIAENFLGVWLHRSTAYLPAAVATLIGVVLPPWTLAEEEQS